MGAGAVILWDELARSTLPYVEEMQKKHGDAVRAELEKLDAEGVSRAKIGAVTTSSGTMLIVDDVSKRQIFVPFERPAVDAK